MPLDDFAWTAGLRRMHSFDVEKIVSFGASIGRNVRQSSWLLGAGNADCKKIGLPVIGYNKSITELSSQPREKLENASIFFQYLAFPGVRGNGIASRTFASPVTYTSVRSNPSPNPACGTVP